MCITRLSSLSKSVGNFWPLHTYDCGTINVYFDLAYRRATIIGRLQMQFAVVRAARSKCMKVALLGQQLSGRNMCGNRTLTSPSVHTYDTIDDWRLNPRRDVDIRSEI